MIAAVPSHYIRGDGLFQSNSWLTCLPFYESHSHCSLYWTLSSLFSTFHFCSDVLVFIICLGLCPQLDWCSRWIFYWSLHPCYVSHTNTWHIGSTQQMSVEWMSELQRFQYSLVWEISSPRVTETRTCKSSFLVAVQKPFLKIKILSWL